MLVPQAMARRAGPVAAVVCAESDPALGIAARIAVAAGEALLLLVWGAPALAQAAAEKARAAGPPQRIITRRVTGSCRRTSCRGWAEQRAPGRPGARCRRRR